MKQLLRKLVNPRIQIGISLVLITGSLIMWPISMLTWARDEPPLILGLSWLALTVSGYAGLIAALGNKAADQAEHDK